MEPEEVSRQVHLMAQAGLGGGFIHSRVGLLTPYLGEEWFAACDATIEACRRAGIKVWLYDEDKWPSGYNGGTVPLADAAYRNKGLIARPVGQTVPFGAEPLAAPQGGLQVYSYISPLGDDWFNGTCYADLMSAEAMRRFLDDAYEPYFARYGDDYGDLIMAQFTDEPCTIFRGRLPQGAVPFTPGLIARFQEMHGYDPTPHLALLFVETPAAPRFRLHYFRVVNDLFETHFSRQLGDWCQAHGLPLTGHYMLEGHLYGQQLWGVKVMPNYRHQGIPGIDHLGRQIEERHTAKQCQSVVNQSGKERMLSELYGVAGGSLSFEDRWWIACQQIALGVNLLNHHLCLYTMSGCRKRDYPQNMFYQQPWWDLNRIVDDPLSRLCVALSQGRYHAEALVLHPQESSFALWQTRSQIDDAQGLAGEHHQWDWNPTLPEARAQIEALDEEFKAVTNALLGAQRTWDFGDETILAQDGSVSHHQERAFLRVGQMEYPAVIVPAMATMATSTLDLLEEFQQAGGCIVRCGEAPRWLDGEASPRLEKWLQSMPAVALKNLAGTLREAVPAAVEIEDLSTEDARLLWVHTRDLEGEEGAERLVFFTNLSRFHAFEAQVRLAGEWATASVLDTRDGTERVLHSENEDGALRVRLPFAPTQGHLLRLSPRSSQARGVVLTPSKTVSESELSSQTWRIERLDDNALTLDYAFFKVSADGLWSERALPVIAIQNHLNALKYTGPLWLRYPVQVAGLSPSRRLHLVVEHPERYRITLNKKRVEYAGLPFWRDIRWLPIDISGQLCEGANEIELHCPRFQPGDLSSIHDAPTRYGTEIESLYLVGDFGARGRVLEEKPVSPLWERYELPPIGVQCFDGPFALTEPSRLAWGDTTTQEMPFYAGRLRFSTDLPHALNGAAHKPGRAVLCLSHLDAPVAQVEVDGRVVGHFATHPLEVELDEAALRGRELSITLFGTLRNLLGPHHHLAGELPQVGPTHFAPTPDTTREDAEWLQKWARREVEAADWRDRYCMVSFGDLGRVSLCRTV